MGSRNLKGRNTAGFSLIETMLVVAVMAVLAAVSIVGIAAYKEQLQIMKLDNAAKSIYMISLNRAVLLKNRGSLEELTVLRDGSGNAQNKLLVDGKSYYYISSSDEAMKKLLPVGTVEASFWDGVFYVVYEPESGSVTDVFYMDTGYSGSFQTLYANRSKSQGDRKSLMIGYYGGTPADR